MRVSREQEDYGKRSSYPMEGLAENQLDALKRSLFNLHHVHHFQILGLGGGSGVVGGNDILC